MYFSKFARSVRANIITGVLTLAPIGAVLWIVIWMWRMLMGIADIIPDALNPKVVLDIQSAVAARAIDFLLTLLVLALILVFIWAVGIVSRNYFGKRIFYRISRFVIRVPVLRTVYTTLEQLLKTFASGQSKNFRRVVQVEYPRKGLYTLAFVTGERPTNPMTAEDGKFLTIYVPTTPNPTSGFYLTVDASEIRDMDMTVEHALKEIISMGIVHKE